VGVNIYQCRINKRLIDFKILVKTLANKKGYSVMAAFGT
jgi:hypothetical protein